MPYTITMAPRVIQGGKVIVGVAGGEYAVRGFFAASGCGNRQRCLEVLHRSRRSFETLRAAGTGRGGQDLERRMVEAGRRRAGVERHGLRSGRGHCLCRHRPAWPLDVAGARQRRQLVPDCILAVRGATGKLIWYYQDVPGDVWDFDSDRRPHAGRSADQRQDDASGDARPQGRILLRAGSSHGRTALGRSVGDRELGVGRQSEDRPAGDQSGSVLRNDGGSRDAGAGGGHVWPPWSYNPTTGSGLHSEPIGQAFNFAADPNFVPNATDLGATGKGQYNMGISFAAAATR